MKLAFLDSNNVTLFFICNSRLMKKVSTRNIFSASSNEKRIDKPDSIDDSNMLNSNDANKNDWSIYYII